MINNYIPRLLALAQNGLTPLGAISVIEVRHDRWCGIFRGEFCNCNPEVVAERQSSAARLL